MSTHNGTIMPDLALQGPIAVKIVSMIVLGCVSFIIGILPIKLVKVISKQQSSSYHLGCGSKDQSLIISLLLCFGGGVLMFTAFLHLQPEVREAVHRLTDRGSLPETTLPLSELFFCGGFFFVYIVEEVVHAFLDKDHDSEEDAVLHRSLSIRRCSTRRNQDGTIIPRASLSQRTDENCCDISTIQNKIGAKPPQDRAVAIGQETTKALKVNMVAQSFRGFLAVMALSFHAIFEGLAVGLEHESSNVWYMFGAIATHKFVIAFCVGMELVSSKTKQLLIVLYIGTFAIVTPLGIFIGTLLSADVAGLDTTADTIATVLQGMAAGTLLYVVFFEVLEKERANSKNGAIKLAAILVGFCVMMILGKIMGHEHHHHHEFHEEHHHANNTHHH